MTEPTQEQIQEARIWIDECEWEEDYYFNEDWKEELTDKEVVEGVEKSHEGGWQGFVQTVFG